LSVLKKDKIKFSSNASPKSQEAVEISPLNPLESDLFKDLLEEILCVRAVEARGVQESWLLFKHHFLHAQDQCIPMSKKSSEAGYDGKTGWVDEGREVDVVYLDFIKALRLSPTTSSEGSSGSVGWMSSQ